MAPLTDEDIAEAFEGTNFGRTDYKHLLALSVLKKSLGYHCGHTITTIMVKSGLTKESGKLTDAGKIFCYDYFELKNSG